MILGEDYKFRDDLIESKEDTCPVEIMHKKYAGTVFRFTIIRMEEKVDEKGPFGAVLFDYDLLETPEGKTEGELKADETFNQWVGNILESLLHEASGQKMDQ